MPPKRSISSTLSSSVGKVPTTPNTPPTYSSVKKPPVAPTVVMNNQASEEKKGGKKMAGIILALFSAVILFLLFSKPSSAPRAPESGVLSTSSTQLGGGTTSTTANFFSDKGNFSIYFAGVPNYQEGTLVTDSGEQYASHLYQYQAPDTSVFHAFYTEYPSSYFIASANGTLLDGVNGSVQSVAGRLVSSEETTYQGYPAIRYQIFIPEEKYYLKGMNVLNGRKVYSIVYIYDEGKEMPSEDYFNSLVIHK